MASSQHLDALECTHEDRFGYTIIYECANYTNTQHFSACILCYHVVETSEANAHNLLCQSDYHVLIVTRADY